MPFDVQNLSVTPTGSGSFTVNTFTIAAQITESRAGGAVLFDLTGANAVQWPQILGTLTAAQRAQIIQLVLITILQMKTGIS